MEGEVWLYVAIISQIGFIIGIQLWNTNWFKRENFRIQKQFDKGEIRLRLKKLEKDLGLKPGKEPLSEKPSKLDTISGLLPILRTLDADQIGALADRFLGDEPLESGSNVTDLIMQYAESNPELVKSFLEGLSGKKTKPEGEGLTPQE